jgi:hypothetical protein
VRHSQNEQFAYQRTTTEEIQLKTSFAQSNGVGELSFAGFLAANN